MKIDQVFLLGILAGIFGVISIVVAFVAPFRPFWVNVVVAVILLIGAFCFCGESFAKEERNRILGLT